MHDEQPMRYVPYDPTHFRINRKLFYVMCALSALGSMTLFFILVGA